MDLPTSITISTAIVMAGIAALTYIKKGKQMNGNVSFKGVHKIITDKLKDVIYRPECEKQIKAFAHEFELMRDAMKVGFDDIKQEIRNIK